ncbi:helix-turn-helix transcriptional regulator, partial [Paenibacillus sp. TAF58]
ITNALNELLSTAGRPFSFKNSKEEQEFIIVLTPSDAATHTINSSVEEAALRLREAFGIELMASVGERTDRLDQLDSSYQSAKSFLLHANMLNPRAVYTSETMCAANRISILAKKDVLLHALEMGSAMYAGNIVRDFFEEVKGSGYFSMEMMLQCSTEFNIVAQRLVSEGSALSPQLAAMLERFELLFDKQVMDFDRYTLSMIEFMEEWFVALLQNHKSTEKLDVELIKSYIDHHYFEDISIALFTEKYFISKEHLLRLFKQRYGSGIYEYTLQIRMEKAKELLMDPELKIQTVSEKIGYNDTNYFSKAFKKHFGISPLAFRRHPSSNDNLKKI